MRKPHAGYFSVERLFEDVRNGMSEEFDVDVYVNPYYSVGFFRRFLGLIRAAMNQGDVNHITGDVHFLTICMRRRRTILTILDCVTLERLVGWRYRLVRYFWYVLPINRSSVVTVISHSTKHELEKHLGRDNLPIVVIPCPVSSEFERSPKEFQFDRPAVLIVGTAKNKNIERMVAALKKLECRLIIIGSLSERQKKLLEETNLVYESHIGITRERVVELYIESDIVLFASLYEGFGLPILEAQSIGRPVITSNLYSMPEVGGDGACYVDPYDVQSIRSAVDRVIQSAELREELICKGYQNVAKYQVSCVAEQYANLYRSVYSECR